MEGCRTLGDGAYLEEVSHWTMTLKIPFLHFYIHHFPNYHDFKNFSHYFFRHQGILKDNKAKNYELKSLKL